MTTPATRGIKRLSYFRVISLAAIVTGCSIYPPDLNPDGGAPSTSGTGGTAVGGGGGSSGDDGGVAPDASVGGSGGSTGGAGGGSSGRGGSAGGKGGSSGSGPEGGAGAAGSGGSGGGTGGTGPGDASGGASGTGGATGTGGAAGMGGTTGTGGSATGGAAGATGGTAGAAGTGGATGGTGGTAGAAGATGGTGGMGGAGGTMDAAPPPGAVFAVGSFTKSTATGAQTVNHTLGQTPKALLLWTIGKPNETLSGGFYYGVGISDGATSAALAMSTRDAVSPSSSSRRIAAKAITLVQGGEVTVAEADLSSWSGGNFRLDWTTNDTQPYVVHYLAIGGPQVQAKVVNWQAPTAVGQKTVSGLGFQPEAVLHLYAGAAFVTAPPFSQTNAVLGVGAMDKTGAQWSIQASDASAQTTTIASRAQRNNAAIYMYTDTGTPAVTKEAAFVSMTSDGFTLNFSAANASASQVYSLALGGLKAGVGTFNKTTAAAPASQSVTTGFNPGAVFLTSYQMAAQTAPLNEANCSFGLGASDGTNEASSAIAVSNGVTTTSVDGIDKTSKVFVKMNMPPLDAEADLASFGATGFTLNWTTADPIASQMCFLALGAP